MFLIGIFFQKNFNFFYNLLKDKFIYCLFVYVLIALVARYLGADFGNSVNPLVFICLAVLIFSAAYTNVTLSRSILNGTDISYGVYIYHMPIVNLLLYKGYGTNMLFAFLALVITILLAACSWFFVEKKLLKLKPKTIKPKL